MTRKELQEKRRRFGYTYEQISYISGVEAKVVQDIFEGKRIPDRATLEALEMAFEIEEDNGDSVQDNRDSVQDNRDSVQEILYEKRKNTDLIREAQATYQVEKRQGEYTVEDYFAIREECRVELIDGVLYAMASAKAVHQKLSTLIEMELHVFIKKKGGNCVSFGAPVSTQLDCDDKTMLEPDITVVCDRSKLQKGYIYGAPDLVIEVLSRSTAKRDQGIKKEKYRKAGVREYWVVDPGKKKIHVYSFEKEDFPTLYSFGDQVPVGIFDGECKVNFPEIYEDVKELYEE